MKHLHVFIPYNHFKREGLQNLRYLLQDGDYLCKLDLRMHIIVFLYRKTRGNTFGSAGQETYTNFSAYGLTWVLPHEFSQDYFTNISQNLNCNSASRKYKNDYLLGRHTSNGSLNRGDKHVSRHSNLVVTSWFCNQIEVCFDTSAGDQIFGTKKQLNQPINI